MSDRFWRPATLAPALAVYAAMALFPVLNLIAISLHDIAWAGGRPSWQYVGLAHYAGLPADALLRAGVANTLIFAVAAVALQMLLGFALALATTRIGRGRALYRALFMLPILVPGIVIGAIWKLMYNFDFGVLNQLWALAGGTPQDWLGQIRLALASVIVVDVWHWTPFVFLLMLAGLESLPQDIYEQARSDGATVWQELVHLTLPLMLPTIAVTVVFRLIVAFKVFDEVYLLTGGGPGTATEVLSFTIYRRFFQQDQMGTGAAMSIATLFVLALAIVLALGFTRRRDAVA
jgi:multiple sugar transport system permease protein